MKECSTFLAIMQVHIKTTLRFYLTPVRIEWLSSRKQTTNVGEDAGEEEGKKFLFTAGGNIN
jgi:hypothetical protein